MKATTYISNTFYKRNRSMIANDEGSNLGRVTKSFLKFTTVLFLLFLNCEISNATSVTFTTYTLGSSLATANSLPQTSGDVTISTIGSSTTKTSTSYVCTSKVSTTALYFTSGTNGVLMDVGSSNHITSIILEVNYSGTTNSKALGTISFSEDNSTFSESSTVTDPTGYDGCNSLTFTPTGTGYRYCKFVAISNNTVFFSVTVNYEATTSCTAPSITTQPSTTAASYCVGATATALTVATSASSPTYQWYSSALGGTTDTVAISGATSASYTPATTTAGTSYYLCKVSSGSCSTMSSASGLITVNAVPTITGVTGGTICSSGTTTLSATASAGTINWYTASTGGTAFTTGTSYTTGTLTSTTSYYVDATDNGCTTASRTAVTATVAAGSVAGTASAASSTICSGSSTTLTLTGYTGSIQWQSSTDGTTYTDISGATSATYTASPTTTTYYRAAVTLGTCSTVYTSAVTVTVASALSISSQSTSAQTLCVGGTATALTVTASGATTYQWYSNSTASNSGGTAVSTGTGGTTSSYTPATTTSGTTYYYCVVSNGTCSATSAISGAITVNAATAIGTQPSSASVAVGGTATLTVAATGAGTLTYQWYSNTSSSNSGGTAISSATSASYSAPTTTAGTYYYYCKVKGSTCNDSVTSSVATVTVSSTSSSIPVPTTVSNGCNTLSWACTDNSSTGYTVNICSGTASDVSISTTGWSTGLPSNTYNYTATNYGYATKSSISCLCLGGASNVINSSATKIFDATAVSGYLIFDLPNGANTISVTRARDVNVYKSTDGGTTWIEIYKGTGSTSDSYTTVTANVNEENAVKIKIVNEYSSWAFVSTITTTNYTGCSTYTTTSKSYTPSSLSPNTTYYVAVKNNEGSSSSNWSSSVLTYVTAPDAPTSLTTSVSSSTAVLGWTAPSGSASLTYTVQYKIDGASSWTTYSSSLTGTTATITGLSAGTTYDFQVKAANSSCSSATWLSGSATTAPATPVPTASTSTTSGFTITWPTITGANGYQVKVCTKDSTLTTEALDGTVSTANGWTDSPSDISSSTCKASGAMIYGAEGTSTSISENGFSITSTTRVGVSTECGCMFTRYGNIITPQITSAGTLTFKAAAYSSGGRIIISKSVAGGSYVTIDTVKCTNSWSGDASLTSFTIPIKEVQPVQIKLYAIDGSIAVKDLKITDYLTCTTAIDVTSNSYTYSTLTPNTKYYYSVRSYKNNSGTYSYSDWSAVSSSTSQVTLENAPTCATPTTNDVMSGFNAKWNAPTTTGGTESYSYRVQLEDSVGNAIGNTVAVDSDLTSYNYDFNTVSSNTNYKYSVWIVNAGGSSDTVTCGAIKTLGAKTLTLKITPSASGSISLGGNTYSTDTVIKVNADTTLSMSGVAGSSYSFLRWIINDSRYTDNPYSLDVTDNMEVTGVFAAQTCTTTNFDALTSSNLATGSYQTQSVTIDGSTWDVANARLSTITYYESKPNSIRLAYPASGDSASIISPVTVTPVSISFYARTGNATSGGKAYVYLSTDNGSTYKRVASESLTTTQTKYTASLSTTSSYCRIKITNASTSGSTSYDIYVDDITICGAPDATPPAITFYPTTGSTNIPIDTTLRVISDEKLYYYASDGSFAALTNSTLGVDSILSRILTLTKVSDGSSVAFTATISTNGDTIYVKPTSSLDYSTQYKLSIKYVSDANENLLASTLYTLFTTKGVPEPRISVKDAATLTSYANGSSYNMGTLIGSNTTTATFRIYNTGSDPLSLSADSCTLTGTGFTGFTLSPSALKSIASGDSASITVTFNNSTTGVYTGILTLKSNDTTNTPYVINLTCTKANFVLPYTYQSGCTTPVATSSELTQDYASTSDIPSEIQIGNLSSSSAVTTSNFNSAYTLFHTEGNCMTDGKSTLRVGSSNKSLILDLDSCGQITFKWCASGYRKVSVTDENGNVYLQSSSWLEGGTCYTNTVVINSCTHNRIMISFEASDSTILTSLYYLNITKCSAELKSSAKDIVKYSFGITGENVRIYSNYIFVTLPSTYTGSLSSLVAKTIEVSPNASVAITTAGDNFGDSTVTYTVTAQDGTTKTYTVSIEIAGSSNSYYSNVISVPVAMKESDKTLSVLEIANKTCTVPSSGTGSSYTIHFLDPSDKPKSGYKIAGLTKLCVGSSATYTLSNAPATNNPSYKWKLSGSSASAFTIVGDSSSSSLTIKAPTTINDSATLSIQILVDFNSDSCQWTTGSANLKIQVTKTAPDSVKSLDGGCLDNGYLTLTAHGAGASASTYNWTFSPSTTQITSQSDSTIVLNIGSSTNDIYATINTQNGCGITKGTKAFPVDYATASTTWTGAVSSAWDNNSNWTARVPKSCTNVTIPDVSVSGVAYPTISDSGECNYITFEPNAAVLGLQKLTYNKAFVELELQRDKWYTLTAPLKNMYSGDYYFSGGAPVIYMRLFNTFNPDTISGGHLYSGTWTKTFASLKVSLNPGEGFAYEIDSAIWNYPHGKTYSHTNKTLTFPRMNSDSSLITKYIPYSASSGKSLSSQTVTLNRYDSIAYRFAMENDKNVLKDVSASVDTGLNLIGNPLMTHLDVTKFINDNSSVIDNKVKFWNGSNFVTYMSGQNLWSASGYTGSLIAPMQSFIVNSSAGGTITFKLSNDFAADTAKTNTLRAANATDNLMYITASNGSSTSSTAITMNSSASNGYGSDDAFKLFTSDTTVPDIYTLSDGIALDINEFKEVPYTTPLGIKTTKYGKITLAFNGADSFGDDVEVSLIDTKANDTINLKDQTSYSLTLDSTNAEGTLFVQFKNATTTTTNVTEATESSVQIFTKDNNVIRVISSPNNLIKGITIMDETGRKVVEKTGLSTSLYDMVMNNGDHVYIVRAVTNQGVKIAKVLIK